MKPIELHWSKKFKELILNDSLTDLEVINEFLYFCEEEEMALAERWEEQKCQKH